MSEPAGAAPEPSSAPVASTAAAPARASTAAARPSLLGRAARILGMAVVSTVAVLAIGEGLARAFGPEVVATPYTPHPYLSRVRTPGFKQVKLTVDDPPRPFLFEIDPLGYRGKSVTTAKKPAGTYRIFFVGASTTENQQLEEERTFPGIVERVLNERTKGSPRVEVANTGIVGYGIDRDFSLIAHQLLQLEPDLIVVNDGGIDMMSSLADTWEPAMLHTDTYTWSIREVLAEESRLVALFDSKFSAKDVDMRRKSFEKKRKIAHAKKPFVPPGLDPKRGLPRFRDYVRRTALICEDAGVPVYFLTQATIWKKDMSPEELDALWMGGAVLPGPICLEPPFLADLIELYNDAIRAEGRKHGGHVIDVAPIVPRTLGSFIDDSHLTAQGNEVLAKAILEAISPDGNLPRGARGPEGSR